MLLLLGYVAGVRWSYVRIYHPRLGVVDIGGGGIRAILGNDNCDGGFELSLGKTDPEIVSAQWSVFSGLFWARRLSSGISISTPIWFPLVLIGLPTAWLWSVDRRRPGPGRCRCGYDLTGNRSGVCPECGILITPPV